MNHFISSPFPYLSYTSKCPHMDFIRGDIGIKSFVAKKLRTYTIGKYFIDLLCNEVYPIPKRFFAGILLKILLKWNRSSKQRIHTSFFSYLENLLLIFYKLITLSKSSVYKIYNTFSYREPCTSLLYRRGSIEVFYTAELPYIEDIP